MLPHNHFGAVQTGLAADQPGAKESAVERAGEVWSYPQAKAVSSAALAVLIVELESGLASYLHHAQAALSADLHDEIMRLACDVEKCSSKDWITAFKEGHKQARHAAAELAAASQQPVAAPIASTKTEGCAGFQGKPLADCGPCSGNGCDGAAPAIQVQESADPEWPAGEQEAWKIGRTAGIEEAAKHFEFRNGGVSFIAAEIRALAAKPSEAV